MTPRFISKRIHAYLDYPVAISLMVLPKVLGLGESNPLAMWLATVTGIAALILTIFTNHHLGVIRVLPYSFHLAVDAIVGITFVLSPFIFKFQGIDAWYYWLNGAVVMLVISLHKPEAEEIAATNAA